MVVDLMEGMANVKLVHRRPVLDERYKWYGVELSIGRAEEWETNAERDMDITLTVGL